MMDQHARSVNRKSEVWVIYLFIPNNLEAPNTVKEQKLKKANIQYNYSKMS